MKVKTIKKMMVEGKDYDFIPFINKGLPYEP